jgi:hypothetical protein
MPNFLLMFESSCNDGAETEVTTVVTRVIFVDDLTLAKKVAGAMLHEEINASQYLTSLISVEETSTETRIGSWNPKRSWYRTLKRLQKQGEFPDAMLVMRGDEILGLTASPQIQAC